MKVGSFSTVLKVCELACTVFITIFCDSWPSSLPHRISSFFYCFHMSCGSVPLHMLCLDCSLCYYWIPAYLGRPTSRFSSFYSELVPWSTPIYSEFFSLKDYHTNCFFFFLMSPAECEFLKQGLWFCFPVNNIYVPWFGKKVYFVKNLNNKAQKRKYNRNTPTTHFFIHFAYMLNDNYFFYKIGWWNIDNLVIF